MNLVKVILDLLFSGDVLGKLCSLLGTDQESTKKATSAAVPAILSGLAGMAASDDGVRKLASTFNGLDPSSLGNLAQMLSGDTSALTQKGSNLLSSLFGDSLVSNIAGSVGKFAGLDNSAAKRLLATIGPSVMGLVAGQWKDQGGGIGALTSLLTGQQKNIAAALPSGFSLASIPGLPSAEGALRVAGQTARTAGAATAEAARRTAGAAEDATTAALKWVGPLAGLLLLALGLWYFFGRGPAAPNVAQNAVNAAAGTAKNAAKATANAASEAVTALKPTLPDLPAVPDITTLTKDVSGIFTSATQALGNIRDAASAQAALPKLTELNTKIDGIRDFFDQLPASAQTALGQLIGKQFAPLQQQAAKIAAMPGVDEQVKSALDQITGKLAGLNLAQVSQDASGIFATLTKTLSGLKDTASAEAAVPKLQEVSGQIDDLRRIQAHMSPGGQTMLSKLVTSARGSLDSLIAKVLQLLGADAAAIKPVLDGIVSKLDWFTQPPSRT